MDVADVISKINAIGTVELTPESKAKIDAAAAAFESLSDKQQALVGNFNTLRAAQTKYDELKAAAENPESPTPISELSATVTAPVGGEHPSFTLIQCLMLLIKRLWLMLGMI